MSKIKGLGRGLDARDVLPELFGELPEQESLVEGIRLSEIFPNPDQPRRIFSEEGLAQLAQSIEQNGVITPLTLRKTADGYQIIAGERRWRAARMAGLSSVPAIVLEVDAAQAFSLALVENLQREDLNPMEEADGYQTLINTMSLTQEQAAEQVGKSRSAVANSLRLLSLPESLRELVGEGLLSAGHARTLLPLGDEKTMQSAAKTVLEKGLSVRQTEALVKTLGREPQQKKEGELALYVKQLEREMSTACGHKIRIQHGKKRGKLTIEYYGNGDLDDICQALRAIPRTQQKG